MHSNSPECHSWIYESPDGGDTVYKRKIGDKDRQLVRSGPRHQQLMHRELWDDIHRSAKIDAVLQNMLDKVEIYHRLKNLP